MYIEMIFKVQEIRFKIKSIESNVTKISEENKFEKFLGKL